MFALYKKGVTHVVDGIQCALARVTEEQILEYKANGWTDDIQELNPDTQKPKGKPGPKPKSPEVLDVHDENE